MNNELKPVLFYYEDAVDAWCQVPELVSSIIESTNIENGETVEISFRRIDMSDKQLEQLEEE